MKRKTKRRGPNPFTVGLSDAVHTLPTTETPVNVAPRPTRAATKQVDSWKKSIDRAGKR